MGGALVRQAAAAALGALWQVEAHAVPNEH